MSQVTRTFTLLSLIVVSWIAIRPAAIAQEYPFFQGSFDDVLKAAQAKDQRILVDVYTVWCGPCKRLITEVFGSQDMRALSDQFIAWRIDAETPEGVVFAKKYNVQRYPTSLFLQKDGTEETRIVGFRERPGYMAEVRRWLAGQATPAAVAPTTPTNAANREDEFSLAYRLAYAGKPNAEADLRALLAKDPKNERGVRAWAMLAIAEWIELRDKKNPAAAEKTLRDLVQNHPESQTFVYAIPLLADTLAAQGKTKEAQKLLEKHIQQRPENTVLVGALLTLCANSANVDLKRCVKQGEAAVRTHTDSAPLWETFAAVQHKARLITEAQTSLKQAATLRADNPWYQKRLSQLTTTDIN